MAELTRIRPTTSFKETFTRRKGLILIIGITIIILIIALLIIKERSMTGRVVQSTSQQDITQQEQLTPQQQETQDKKDSYADITVTSDD
jgi:Na+-transporting methylmalonyl-CoA/oxaloacetate decarboxylase gamma subunit